MPTTITGTSGVSAVQDGSIVATDLNGNQTGSAPIYGARAWCVFNGSLTGTNAPTSGANVTSVTRVSTGVYTITFATAMPNADYSIVSNCSLSGVVGFTRPSTSVARTTTTCQVDSLNNAGAAIDPTAFHVVIFG